MKRILSAFLVCLTVPSLASAEDAIVLRCHQRQGDISRSLLVRELSIDSYTYELAIDREGAAPLRVYFDSGLLKRRPINHSCMKSFFSDNGVEIETNPYCATMFYNPAARMEMGFEYSDCN